MYYVRLPLSDVNPNIVVVDKEALIFSDVIEGRIFYRCVNERELEYH